MNLYRYEEWPTEDGPRIYLRTFPVIKETKCGFWIDLRAIKPRFVLRDSTKKFAATTEARAKESFLARKKCQIKILTHRLDYAKRALQLMKENKYRPLPI